MATVHLCRVPFDNTYDNVIEFASLSFQEQYFTNCTVATITNSQYVKKNDPYIVVPYSYENANVVNSNYVWVEQNNKNYFFFITDKRYNKSDATYLDLEYDVWQSNMLGVEYSLVSNYINRSHVDRWDADGTPIWWTANEGFNVTKDHLVQDNTIGASTVTFVVITIVDNEKLYYIIQAQDSFDRPVLSPEYQGGGESWLDITFNSITVYNCPAVKAIYSIPYVYNRIQTTTDNGKVKLTLQDPLLFATTNTITVGEDSWTILGYRVEANGFYEDQQSQHYNQAIFGGMSQIKIGGSSAEGESISIPTRPNYNQNSLRRIANESKLFSSQFRRYSLSTLTGATDIKLEEANNTDIPIYFSVVRGANRNIVYALGNYGGLGSGYNFSTLFSDTQQGSYNIISNTEASYIQNTASQNETAVLSKLGTAGLYATATAILAMFPPTAPFAVGTAFSTASSLTGAVTETARIDAKISDSENSLENFVVSSSSGTLLENVGYGKLRLIVKTATPTVLNAIYEFLYHYGYTINTYEIPDVYSRYYFNYLSMSTFNIKYLTNKRMSTTVKNSLAAIYRKGVRIWHYNTATAANFNMLDYTYENCETSLLG